MAVWCSANGRSHDGDCKWLCPLVWGHEVNCSSAFPPVPWFPPRAGALGTGCTAEVPSVSYRLDMKHFPFIALPCLTTASLQCLCCTQVPPHTLQHLGLNANAFTLQARVKCNKPSAPFVHYHKQIILFFFFPKTHSVQASQSHCTSPLLIHKPAECGS